MRHDVNQSSTESAQQSCAVVDTIMIECIKALFEGYGMSLSPAGDAGCFELVAVVGFAGQGVRGSLGLGIKNARAFPMADDVEDYILEMSNQLLGRIKNRLAARGVKVEMAVPTLLRDLELRIKPGNHVYVYPYVANGSEICAWLDARPPEALGQRRSTTDRAVATEGDILFF